MRTAALVRGSGLIAIPSLGTDFDIPPTTPSPWDDEFDGPLGGHWQPIDASSSGYTTDANSTIGSCFTIRATGTPTRTPGIKRPCPPFPFTVTTKVAANAMETASFAASDRGLWLGEAGAGTKFIHGCLDAGTTGKLVICGSYWTDFATWNNNIGLAGPGSAMEESGFAFMKPHYVQFRVTNATTVTGWFSFDGRYWIKWLDTYTPGFNIGMIGLDAHMPQNSAVSFDWIRVTLG